MKKGDGCEVLLPTGDWQKGSVDKIHRKGPHFQVSVFINLGKETKWIITTQRKYVRTVKAMLEANKAARLEDPDDAGEQLVPMKIVRARCRRRTRIRSLEADPDKTIFA